MNVLEIIKITDGTLIRKYKEKEIQTIKIDSRKIEKGDAFLAISSGHDYIKEAVKNGATLLIVDRDIEIHKKVNIIKVEDSIEALQKIASYIRQKYNPIVIGITGSVGKTTTKEMLYRILSKKFNVIKNEGNENNHIGVPKTLLKINDDTDIVITEMGMNHEGEIQKLSMLAKPDIAIITNIGTSHIGNMKSKKNICNEKLQIVSGMEDGILVINQDDPCLKKVKKLNNAIVYRVGTKEDADLVAYDVREADIGIESLIYIDDKEYILQAISKPFLLNKLLVIQTALFFEISIQDILTEIEYFIMTNNRLERFEVSDIEVISDCYNASLESFTNVLDIIKKEKKEKILILGDILELGKYSKNIHQKLGKKIKKIKNCKLILVGESVKYIYKYNKKRSILCNNNDEIKKLILLSNLRDKIILIKGSHGIHLEEITNFIKSEY